MKTNRFPARSERGSLLIVAMLLCAIIELALVTYLKLGTTAMRVSNRALFTGAAMNLAENGLEQSVYTINKMVADSTYSWTGHGWTIAANTTDAYEKWTGFSLGQGVTGQVQAYVYNYNGAAPSIVSRSVVTIPGQGGGTQEKWIFVQLRKTSKFSNGLVAKNSISFSGNNASVDSWNSDPDNNPATAAIAYSSGVKHDNGSVGSISVAVNAITVSNADIWGYASTGGSLPSVGPNGTVGPFGTASGTMDMSHVSTDFTTSFDAVTAPTATYNNYGGTISTTTTLPRPGIDPQAADGNYYITADSINFNNKTLTIAANVVLLLTNTGTAIDIGGGSGQLSINSGASLKVYASGDIKIAGNGIMNGGTTTTTANQPVNCQFYGTKTSGSQSIQIAGNGVLSAVVYAPQGSIKINGNGDVMGSMVGNDITVVGNAAFHYDESLANFGGNNPYRVSKWQELTTSTQRDTYASVFSGW
ncbi:MAG TPA: hypothetical protein VHE61_16345 [Opitutaceae bacterium]|nr:hypothetical protein [Opitutaceae bacterium]